MRLTCSRELTPGADATPAAAPPCSCAPLSPVATYLAQKRALARLRAAHVVDGVAVPRATTRDVLEVATWWTREADKVRGAWLGGDSRDDDVRALEAWRTCLDQVWARFGDVGLETEYPDGAHVWSCVARLARHLEARQVAPSAWAPRNLPVVDDLVGAVEKRIDELGTHAQQVGVGAGAAAGDAAADELEDKLEDLAKRAALPIGVAVAAVIGTVFVVRSTSTETRALRRATKERTMEKKSKKRRRS